METTSVVLKNREMLAGDRDRLCGRQASVVPFEKTGTDPDIVSTHSHPGSVPHKSSGRHV